MKTTLRSLLGVPLKRDQEVLGALCVARPEPRGFNSRHIEILQTFADQAVIAIENVRLFDEVQARTRDLEESLAQQTATADVLKVISRSAFDLDTVLQTLVESARQTLQRAAGRSSICARATSVGAKAMVGHSGELMQRVARHAAKGRTRIDRAARDAVGQRRAYRRRADGRRIRFSAGWTETARGFRALLGVPLLREGKVEGVFVVSSAQARPFH